MEAKKGIHFRGLIYATKIGQNSLNPRLDKLKSQGCILERTIGNQRQFFLTAKGREELMRNRLYEKNAIEEFLKTDLGQKVRRAIGGMSEKEQKELKEEKKSLLDRMEKLENTISKQQALQGITDMFIEVGGFGDLIPTALPGIPRELAAKATEARKMGCTEEEILNAKRRGLDAILDRIPFDDPHLSEQQRERCALEFMTDTVKLCAPELVWEYQQKINIYGQTQQKISVLRNSKSNPDYGPRKRKKEAAQSKS